MQGFPVTVTIAPNAKTCGDCPLRVFIPYGTYHDKDFCRAFGQVLETKPIGKVTRCPECLAAEKASKDGER